MLLLGVFTDWFVLLFGIFAGWVVLLFWGFYRLVCGVVWGFYRLVWVVVWDFCKLCCVVVFGFLQAGLCSCLWFFGEGWKLFVQAFFCVYSFLDGFIFKSESYIHFVNVNKKLYFSIFYFFHFIKPR